MPGGTLKTAPTGELAGDSTEGVPDGGAAVLGTASG